MHQNLKLFYLMCDMRTFFILTLSLNTYDNFYIKIIFMKIRRLKKAKKK